MSFCQKCGAEYAANASFCVSCGDSLALVAQPTSGKDVMSTIFVESLGVLRHTISRNNAYLGVAIGFSVFAFALFLPWASIPVGLIANDGGSVIGWKEGAYFAIFPFVFALYPVFLHRTVSLKNLLANIVISFALLGYNNVINRTTWHSRYSENLGSDLSVGFWIGLMAIVAISVFGLAWSMHTSGNDE